MVQNRTGPTSALGHLAAIYFPAPSRMTLGLHCAALVFLCDAFVSGLAAAQTYTPPSHHADIEQIARDTAYVGATAKGSGPLAKDEALLQSAEGHGLKLEDAHDDPNTGFQAMVFERKSDGHKIIAFRGTWPSDTDGQTDVIADLDIIGDTGSSQYNANKTKLEEWARKYPDATVTGHSLGAALGQRYLSEHAGAVREGVFFNAPAIGRHHTHRFARSKVQPPVTIYVGRSQPTPGTLAPAHDIVSEYGGQSHLPGRVIEVTKGQPTDGFKDTLMSSHTAHMLDGKERRQLREIPYADYQRRRQDSWQAGEPFFNIVRVVTGQLDASAAILQEMEGAEEASKLVAENLGPDILPVLDAAANIVSGFGRAKSGPAEPTQVMLESADRDCALAIEKADQALARVQGRLTGTSMARLRLDIMRARETSIGCPQALGKIAAAERLVDAAAERFLNTARGTLKSCDVTAVKGAANTLAAVLTKSEVAAVHTKLKERAEALEAAKREFEKLERLYLSAEKKKDLGGMHHYAGRLMSAANRREVQGCFDDVFMTGRNLRTQITSWQADMENLKTAGRTCDMTRLKQLYNGMKADQHPIVQAMVADLKSQYKVCRNKLQKPAPESREPKLKLAGRWHLKQFKHKGKNKWHSPKRGFRILDVSMGSSGSAGTVRSWSATTQDKEFRGHWRILDERTVQVNWNDGERLTYRIVRLTSSSAHFVHLNSGLQTVLGR